MSQPNFEDEEEDYVTGLRNSSQASIAAGFQNYIFQLSVGNQLGWSRQELGNIPFNPVPIEELEDIDEVDDQTSNEPARAAVQVQERKDIYSVTSDNSSSSDSSTSDDDDKKSEKSA